MVLYLGYFFILTDVEHERKRSDIWTIRLFGSWIQSTYSVVLSPYPNALLCHRALNLNGWSHKKSNQESLFLHYGTSFAPSLLSPHSFICLLNTAPPYFPINYKCFELKLSVLELPYLTTLLQGVPNCASEASKLLCHYILYSPPSKSRTPQLSISFR